MPDVSASEQRLFRALPLLVDALLDARAMINKRSRRHEAKPSHRRSLLMELMEPRLLLTGDFPELDGSNHHPLQPQWGAVNQQLLRLTTASYEDGRSAPSGADRPSPRAISNQVSAQVGSALNDRQLTDYVWAWGQFVDHDLDLTEAVSPAESFAIPVPQGDPHFDPQATGSQVIQLNRSNYDRLTGSSSPRQQINQITAYLDASMVYGVDSERAAALRTFESGQLRTSAGNLLPLNTAGFPNAPSPDPSLFLAGDVRANENVMLTSLHTLFMREHNRLAAEIAQSEYAGADLSDPAVDEAIYQEARIIVIAEIQAITFNEFLPALLGPSAPASYQGYDAAVNPGIANIFSTAAYRVGHTMLSPSLLRLDENGQEIAQGSLPLRSAFFNPSEVINVGIEPLLRGAAEQLQQEVDVLVIDDVRNFLFGPPGSGGFDLASLNIQRGRDHGLPSYNQARRDLGLTPVTSLAEITSNPEIAARLRQAYGTVDRIDVWVGGLAEDHLPGSSVGELFATVIVDQFQRIRDGDRFWYQNHLAVQQVEEINNTRLSDIIQRNTNVAGLQDNVFLDRSVMYYREPSGSERQLTLLRAMGGRYQILDQDDQILADRPIDNVARIVMEGPLDQRTEPYQMVVSMVNPMAAPVSLSAQGMRLAVDGSAGNDVFQLSLHGLEVNGTAMVLSASTLASLEVHGLDGDDIITVLEPLEADVAIYGDAGRDQLFGSDGVERLYGGSGDDRLVGKGGADVLQGEAGDDDLDGGAGYDHLFGGDGNDLLIGGSGDDVLMGEAGHDVLRGNEGRDTIDGGPGDDIAEGGGANDLLYGRAGKDILSGGDGADSLLGGPDDDMIFGQGGHDRLMGDEGNDRLFGGIGLDTIYGGPGDDWIDGEGSNDLVYAGPGDDLVQGGLGGDKLFGGSGNDILIGNAGNDRLYGQDGDDLMSGGDGDDLATGGNGNDWLFGGDGNDQLLGNAGRDYLIGNAGNDTLDGGKQDDWLLAGPGVDTLLGTVGNDTLVGDNDDSFDGGAGQDRLIGPTGFRNDSELQALPTATLQQFYAAWDVWRLRDPVVSGQTEIEFPDTTLLDQLAQ